MKSRRGGATGLKLAAVKERGTAASRNRAVRRGRSNFRHRSPALIVVELSRNEAIAFRNAPAARDRALSLAQRRAIPSRFICSLCGGRAGTHVTSIFASLSPSLSPSACATGFRGFASVIASKKRLRVRHAKHIPRNYGFPVEGSRTRRRRENSEVRPRVKSPSGATADVRGRGYVCVFFIVTYRDTLHFAAASPPLPGASGSRASVTPCRELHLSAALFHTFPYL